MTESYQDTASTTPQQFIKGVAVRSTIEYIEDEFGPDVLEKVLTPLSDEFQKVLRSKIKKRDWIDLTTFLAFCKSAIDVIWDGDVNKAHDWGYYSAKESLPTIYKVLYKLGNVDYIINKASSIFDSYYKPAKLQVAKNSPQHVTLFISDLYDPSTILIRRIVGYLRASIELSGGNYAQFEWKKNENDDGSWQIDMKWQ